MSDVYELMHSIPTLLFLHFQLSTEKLSGRATTFCSSGRSFESGRRASEIHFNNFQATKDAAKGERDVTQESSRDISEERRSPTENNEGVIP